MNPKILIVDDVQSITTGVQRAFGEVGWNQVSTASYCDDAFTKLQAAAQVGEPYDLVVSDLSFSEDHVQQRIKSGLELMHLLKKEQPQIWRVAFSVSRDRHEVKDALGSAHAYVLKGRNGTKDLITNIEKLMAGQLDKIVPPPASLLVGSTQLTPYDIRLINFIAAGLDQKEIHLRLAARDIKPNSRSTIEKRLADIRLVFNARNNSHLVSLAKDKAII